MSSLIKFQNQILCYESLDIGLDLIKWLKSHPFVNMHHTWIMFKLYSRTKYSPKKNQPIEYIYELRQKEKLYLKISQVKKNIVLECPLDEFNS